MKNNIKLFAITAMVLVVGFLTVGCTTEPTLLSAPTNVAIDVTGRTMTVTWAAVTNASGYEIITDSENCGSGKRKINTQAGTAVVNNPDSTSNGADALKTDKSNGAVEILGATKIQITLMPKMGDDTVPMATAVTARVMSLGGKVAGKDYIDSDYSPVARKALSSGGM